MPPHYATPMLACHDAALGVRIAAPSAQEQAAIDSFVALATLAESDGQDPAPPDNQLHLVRKAGAGAASWRGMVGTSADGAWLIFFMQGHQHLYLVPIDDVLGFELLRLPTASSPGTAFLMISCRRSHAHPLLLTIARQRAPDALAALTPLARQLAGALARPLLFHPFEAFVAG